MIARIWTGTTRDADADACEEDMREVAMPGYTDIPGRRTMLMLCRPGSASGVQSNLKSSRHSVTG
jgi:hypothetical protein